MRLWIPEVGANMPGHLIIIDEDKSLASGIARALRLDFRTISVLQSPLNTQGIIQDARSTVIISEIRFSTLDGTVMLRKLRETFPLSQIIALSAHYSEATLNELKKAGVTSILEKPVEMEHLKEEIKKLIPPKK